MQRSSPGAALSWTAAASSLGCSGDSGPNFETATTFKPGPRTPDAAFTPVRGGLTWWGRYVGVGR